MDTIYLSPQDSDYFLLPYNDQTGKLTTIHRDALDRIAHPDAPHWPRQDLALVGQGFGHYKVTNCSRSQTAQPC